MERVIHTMQQGTDEWHAVRKYRFTGSNATAIAAAGAGLDTYVKKKILEIMGKSEERYYGADMERGHDLEPLGRLTYAFERKVNVYEVGFISFGPDAGCSPDGMVDADGIIETEDGIIEIKARNNEKHFELLTGGAMESGVKNQMQYNLYVSGRAWCDFVSYNPNFAQPLFVQRFRRDEAYIQKIEMGLLKGSAMLKVLLQNEVVAAEIKALDK